MTGFHYDIGDVIEYETFGGRRRQVLVNEKSDDIKNGHPGFAGTLVGPGSEPWGVWGYADQIVSVVRSPNGTETPDTA